MSKLINQIHRFKKIAGLLKEEDDIDLSDTPQFTKYRFKYNPNWDEEDISDDSEGAYGNEIVGLYRLDGNVCNSLWGDYHISIEKTPEDKYYVHFWDNKVDKDMETLYDTIRQAQEAAAALMDEIVDDCTDDTERPEYD